MNIVLKTVFSLMFISAMASGAQAVESADEALTYMQKQWAINNYQLQGKEQATAFEQLVAKADQFVEQYPRQASLWVWSGIIKSTYAGVKGGIGALKYAKASKADLEKAMELNADVLSGSAYTSLGTLYFKVPGWPIAFGDEKKAEKLLKKALDINPQGIDPNYFYAEFLREQKQYQQAKEYLQRALNAKPRPGREVADEGRRNDIETALVEVEKQLK